jgi:hypothetical protein
MFVTEELHIEVGERIALEKVAGKWSKPGT